MSWQICMSPSGYLPVRYPRTSLILFRRISMAQLIHVMVETSTINVRMWMTLQHKTTRATTCAHALVLTVTSCWLTQMTTQPLLVAQLRPYHCVKSTSHWKFHTHTTNKVKVWTETLRLATTSPTYGVHAVLSTWLPKQYINTLNSTAVSFPVKPKLPTPVDLNIRGGNIWEYVND